MNSINEVLLVLIITTNHPMMLYKSTIKDSYGEEFYNNITKLQKLKQRSANAKNQWIFMQRCLTTGILLKSFKTSPTLNTKRGWNITRSYNRMMLNAAKNDCKDKYHRLLKDIKNLQSDLQFVLDNEHFEKACQITEKSRESTFVKNKNLWKPSIKNFSQNLK